MDSDGPTPKQLALSSLGHRWEIRPNREYWIPERDFSTGAIWHGRWRRCLCEEVHKGIWMLSVSAGIRVGIPTALAWRVPPIPCEDQDA